MRDRATRPIGVVLVATAVVLTGCSAADPGVTETEQPAPTAPIRVETRSITSVVTLAGTVLATPAVHVLSPARGPLRIDLDAQTVDRGQPLGLVGEEPVEAPADGSVQTWMVADGSVVDVNVPVVAMTYPGFAITASVPSELLYRIYTGPSSAKGAITGGPAGFDCDIATTDTGEADSDGGLSILCLVPPDVVAFAGLEAVIAVQTSERAEVPTLPITAVLGEVDRGQVVRVGNDGRRSVVDVGLGVSDGSHVEITSGIAVGDRVLPYAPELGR